MGLAAVGIGLGFHALFSKLEPAWVPECIATLFIGFGMLIFWTAQRNGRAVQERLDAHKSRPLRSQNLKLIAAPMAIGSIALAAGIWVIEASE